MRTKEQIHEALEKSITKWQKIVDTANIYADIHSSSCPLCHIFMRHYNSEHYGDDCIGCPVVLKTDQGGCQGTPWHKVNTTKYSGTVEEFVAAATEMLEFLKSLRPVKPKSELEATT